MLVNRYYDLERSRKAAKEGRHRDVIGGRWEVGALSFDFLRTRGLQPGDRVLDIGCGCLRLGVHLVEFLEAGRYWGTDISQELLDAGYDVELAERGLRRKLPRDQLVCDGDFDFRRLGHSEPFDMVVALSVFTHLPLNHIRLCLANLGRVTRPGTVFYATIFHCPDEKDWTRPIPVEGDISTHPARDPYHYRLADLERCARGLPWEVGEPIEWGHPLGQTMVAFTRRPAPEAVFVLGMHRSGTSCLTGCLEEAGLTLGEVNRSAPHNRKGNQENLKVMALNNDVLAESGGDWSAPPERLSWTDEHRRRRDELLADYPPGQLIGIKDPRQLLTLPFWREGVPEARLVGIFRHPLAVARSLNARDGMPEKRALELWARHNRLLLEEWERSPFPLLCFDLPYDDFREGLDRVTTQLGLTPPADGYRFFDSRLRHAVAPDGRLPDDVAQTYERLRRASVPSSPAADRRPADPADSPEVTPTGSEAGLLSVVVVVYDMPREAPRTLHSLSPAYQRGVEAGDYEVVVVENGSSRPLDPAAVEAHGPNFRYHFLEDASPSPAAAMNLGAELARGEHLGLLIDGARVVSPGVVRAAIDALAAFPRPVVGTLGFHLGPDAQMRSLSAGYDQAVEDELLEKIDWPRDGYRLFEISAFAESSRRGWFGIIDESNCIFMPRALYGELGGLDEAFDSPGGGMVNLDFWVRACELPDSTLVSLLGEGSFHQFHGGAATGLSMDELDAACAAWADEYRRIRGKPFASPARQPLLYGRAHPASLPWVRGSVEIAAQVAAEGDVRVNPAERPARPEGVAPTLDVMYRRLRAAERERDDLEKRFRDILSSRSWKLTAPLRALRQGPKSGPRD